MRSEPPVDTEFTPPADFAPPTGLPDIAGLADLANQFFRALPEAGPIGVSTLTTTPPAPAVAPATPGAAPRLVSGQPVPSELPSSVAETLPPAGGRSGGIAPGVPESYAPALPNIDAAPQAPPASPYYFLGEGISQAAPASAIPQRINAQPYAFPGEDELRDLVRQLGGPPGSPRDPISAVPATGPQPYYFLQQPVGTADVPQLPQDVHPAFDVNAIRRDFPILAERVNGRPLVWFDNAATTQKPQAVLDRLDWFYAHENSNIHRAAHELAARATDAYESARKKVARFIGASTPDEIIFVRGATEGINLIAQTFGKQFLNEGDEIVLSHLEHHANIVPWQQIAAEKGARIRVIPVDDSGQILLEEYRKLLNDRTKIVSVAHVSNALGTITPVKDIVELAHGVGAVAIVDAAQSVSHLRVNLQALDADFLVFSGHKIFAPTGIGAVYGKKALLDRLPPWQGGGNMIEDVTFERTLYNPAPARFEAGTGNIADAVGLGAALDYVERSGLENIARYEHDLLEYGMHELRTISGLRLIGTAKEKTSVLSFVLAGYRTDEVGKALNAEGIAVRSGHHCAQPILRRFGVEATVRPSIAFYNTCEEIDRMITVLRGLVRGRV